MPTILDIARHADVPAESVVRVVRGEPISAQVALRVQQAIDELGPPYPYNGVDATHAGPSVEVARRQLLDSFAETAAQLESTLPEGVGSVVYEALRVEVRPVAQHVSQLATLVEHLVDRLQRLDDGVTAERHERLEDVALLTELMTTGWRSVDARLARVEHILGRLEEAGENGNRRRDVRRFHFEA
jgi:hypothetical protein